MHPAGPPPPFGHFPPGQFRPPPYGFPPGLPPNPGMPGSPTQSGANEQEKKIFVGRIPPGITDEWMEQLLQTCGLLKEWSRLKPNGKPQGFGFAKYDDLDSELRALRLLNKSGERPGVTIKAQDGSDVEKTLLLKVDESVEKEYEEHQRTRKKEGDAEQDTAAEAAIKDLIQTLESKGDRHQARRDDTQRRGRRGSHHDDHGKRRDREQQHFVRASSGRPDFEDDGIDDEEFERRRKEREAKNAEISYRKKEERYRHFEKERFSDYQRSMEEECIDVERFEDRKEKLSKRLAEYDDAIMKDKDEFYTDPSRWRKARRRLRRDEERADEEDRVLEVEELEEARKRKEEEMRREEELRKQQLHKEQGQKITIKPTMLGMKPIKRRGNLGGDDDEEDEGNTKRRVLIPLDYGDDEDVEAKRKRLLDSTPSTKAELFAREVKWGRLTDDLIEDMLSPFVTKKMLDLTGTEDIDINKHVIDLIRQHSPPEKIVEEMEFILDEDAPTFVIDLWRHLLVEIEMST